VGQTQIFSWKWSLRGGGIQARSNQVALQTSSLTLQIACLFGLLKHPVHRKRVKEWITLTSCSHKFLSSRQQKVTFKPSEFERVYVLRMNSCKWQSDERLNNHIEAIVRPPSTTKSAPVVYFDSSEARYTLAYATSQAVPILPVGLWECRLSMRFWSFSGDKPFPMRSVTSGVNISPTNTT